MPIRLGQFVLLCKDKMACDIKGQAGLHSQMPKQQSKDEYKQLFIERVKAARIARGMTQITIADLLGMEQDGYKQYETRSLLPNHLMERFCSVCSVDLSWLITGKGKGPALQVATSDGKRKSRLA